MNRFDFYLLSIFGDDNWHDFNETMVFLWDLTSRRIRLEKLFQVLKRALEYGWLERKSLNIPLKLSHFKLTSKGKDYLLFLRRKLK